MEEKKIKFYYDASFWFLLGTNIFTILFACIGKWSFADVMWVYWGQSVAIGIVNIIIKIR